MTTPKLRLFLFHHAGGSSALYEKWADYFPPEWELCPLDAPGRGPLISLPPLDDSAALADFFHSKVLPRLDLPFAFFGHSMGAVTAFELSRRLQAAGDPQPVWLGLSACRSPWFSATGGGQYALPDTELREWLEQAGGTEQNVLRHPLAWLMFAPLLRADLKLVDSWAPDVSVDALSTSLAVFGAADDSVVRHERMDGWAMCAKRFLGLHIYPGGHFYLQSQLPTVARDITASITEALNP